VDIVYKGFFENYAPDVQGPTKTGNVYTVSGATFIYETATGFWFAFKPAVAADIVQGQCQFIEDWQQIGSDMGHVEMIKDCKPDVATPPVKAMWKKLAADHPWVKVLNAAAEGLAAAGTKGKDSPYALDEISSTKNICDIILVETIKSYLL
jgi:hypothetical protein